MWEPFRPGVCLPLAVALAVTDAFTTSLDCRNALATSFLTLLPSPSSSAISSNDPSSKPKMLTSSSCSSSAEREEASRSRREPRIEGSGRRLRGGRDQGKRATDSPSVFVQRGIVPAITNVGRTSTHVRIRSTRPAIAGSTACGPEGGAWAGLAPIGGLSFTNAPLRLLIACWVSRPVVAEDA